jgi:Zn-dependent protease with chaperone function
MSCAAIILPSIELGRKLIAPTTILVLPLALGFCFGNSARKQTKEEQRKAVWLGYRRLSRFVMAITLAGWWATWDSNHLAGLVAPFVPWLSRSLEPSSVETILFWIPPIVSLSALLALNYATDTVILRLKWTLADVLRLVWWRLSNFVIPLLMIATGFDDILRGELWGCVWISAAGIVAIIATIYLGRAEGMKLHEVKASQTRNRALAMARRMGIELRRIYVMPAGRGHLTNAFGGGTSIGLTDNLAKYLNRRQVEFVIAHELGHVQQKHGRNRLLLTIAIYSAMTIVLFLFRRELVSLRPLLDALIILAPLATGYFVSRRHEYEADRKAVDFTGDPESGMRAMMGLLRVTGEPMQCSRLTEMFLTHPAFARRAEAIGRAGAIPTAKIAEIVRDGRLWSNNREGHAVTTRE